MSPPPLAPFASIVQLTITAYLSLHPPTLQHHLPETIFHPFSFRNLSLPTPSSTLCLKVHSTNLIHMLKGRGQSGGGREGGRVQGESGWGGGGSESAKIDLTISSRGGGGRDGLGGGCRGECDLYTPAQNKTKNFPNPERGCCLGPGPRGRTCSCPQTPSCRSCSS